MHATARRRAGGLLGSLIIAGGILLPATASHAAAAPVLDDPISFDSGHIDAFAVVPGDTAGAPRLVLQEDVTGSHIHRNPESVELLVKSQARVENYPAAASPPGMPSSVYQLPLTQNPQLIWPGWDTTRLSAEFGSARTTIDITSVEGPGDVWLWSQGSFGNPTSNLTRDGQPAWNLPATITVPAPAHVHSNWAFTEAGTYTLTAQATVTPAGGQPVSTNSAEYTFTVAPSPTSLAISGADESVQSGETVELTAAQSPADSTWDAFTWWTRASAESDWVEVAGETAATVAIPAVDGQQVRAIVSGGQNITAEGVRPLAVESAPVTISTIGDGQPEEPEEPEQPQQSVTIAPLGHHYHSGGPIALSATATPAVTGATYAWFVQRPDQSEPVQLAATSAATSLVAEQALDGAEVTVELRNAEGENLASAGPSLIDIDDHGSAPLQVATVSGIAHHYHSGDAAELTASVAPASVLDRWQWYVQRAGDDQPTELEGETASTLSFAVDAEWDGAAVIAALTFDDGRTYVQSNPVLVTVDDHGAEPEIPATELTISTDRAADDYWVGQTARLTAAQSTPTNLTAYRWLAKTPGSDAFEIIDGQAAATYSFKPTLANSGIEVKSQLMNGTEVHAESDAVAITTQQRPVATELRVGQSAPTFVDGEVAVFRTVQYPSTGIDHYHWYIKRAGASDFVWIDQSREDVVQYPVSLADDGAEIVVRLFDETHAVIAESTPVTLEVTPKSDEPEEPIETTLTIDGLAGHYHTGDTARLAAVQTPPTGEDHYHWFIKRAGDDDFAAIAGAFTGILEHVIADGDADAQIVAKLYDHTHTVIAESEPVTLHIDDHHGETPSEPGEGETPGEGEDPSEGETPGEGEEPGQGEQPEGKPAAAPVARTGAELDGVDSGAIELSDRAVRPGQVVTIDLGREHAGTWNAVWLFSEPRLLGGDWLQADGQGRIAVTIPSDATAGDHRIAVFGADGELVGWESLSIAATGAAGAGADAEATDGALAATGADALTIAPVAAVLLLMGAALAVAAQRRRRLGDQE